MIDGARGRLAPLLGGLGIPASGLSAQRARMDVSARNIANADVTRGVDGTPYRRGIVALEEVPFAQLFEGAEAARAGGGGTGGGVRVAGIEEDATEGPLVYDPGHPDANEEGYVRSSNVSVTDEMATLTDARRLFDANATVFEAMKSMLRRATQL